MAKASSNTGKIFEQKVESLLKQYGLKYTKGYEVLTITGRRKIDFVIPLLVDESVQMNWIGWTLISLTFLSGIVGLRVYCSLSRSCVSLMPRPHCRTERNS